MEYQIALSPELGVSPADFVAAWNETAACRAVATAGLAESTSRHYDPSLVAAAALTVLRDVSLGVAGNALYDLIKQTLAGRGVRRETAIIQVERPDGTRLLIVRIRE